MFFFISFCFSFEFHLKVKDLNKYFSYNGAKNVAVSGVEKADIFQLKPLDSIKAAFKSSNNEGSVLDVENGVAIYAAYNGSGTQKYELVLKGNGFYYLNVIGKCITYNENQEKFELKTCDPSNQNQYFEVICPDSVNSIFGTKVSKELLNDVVPRSKYESLLNLAMTCPYLASVIQESNF